jgi:hypothetical protein
MKSRIVFWDVLPCKIIVDRRFRGVCCLHHIAKDRHSVFMKFRIVLWEDNSERYKGRMSVFGDDVKWPVLLFWTLYIVCFLKDLTNLKALKITTIRRTDNLHRWIKSRRHLFCVTSQVLTAANMKIRAFWDVAWFILAGVGRRCRGAYYLYIQDDDGGSTYVWNVGLVRDYTALHPRRL